MVGLSSLENTMYFVVQSISAPYYLNTQMRRLKPEDIVGRLGPLMSMQLCLLVQNTH